jgi:hypothetical protein
MGGMRRFALAVLLLGTSAFAQTPGKASFVVYEKASRSEHWTRNVSRTDDGWRIQGSMLTKGSVPVRIVNLDLLYDRNWFGRWLTMEMKQPDDVIVHVAVGRTTAQTDVVRPNRGALSDRAACLEQQSCFRNRAYGAYEAVAARLSISPPGDDSRSSFRQLARPERRWRASPTNRSRRRPVR